MLSFRIHSAGAFHWDVVDMLGRRVRSSSREAAAPGAVTRRVALDGLRQGSYFLRVQSEGRVLTRSFLILE